LTTLFDKITENRRHFTIVTFHFSYHFSYSTFRFLVTIINFHFSYERHIEFLHIWIEPIFLTTMMYHMLWFSLGNS